MKILPHLYNLLIRKANKSICPQKVAAIGINRKGEVVASFTNLPRFTKKGGGLHGEMRIMLRYPSVKTIIIARVGRAGDVRPLSPCDACWSKANELGIKIVSVL